MMKKITNLLTGLFLLVAVNNVNAQGDCNLKYNLFKGNVTTKKYTEAKPTLEYLMKNCPSLSVNIYKYGAKIAEKTQDSDLMRRVYEARIANFSDAKYKPAKAHSDYATFLIKNKLGSETQIQGLLEKAYALSPKDMSVKNIYRYFEGVLNTYKDSDTQKVFDTYDNVMESVNEKLDAYNAKISPLLAKEEAGTLTKKEAKKLNAYKINSKALGQVEGGLDAKLSSIATCERLIPLLSRDFENKKTDVIWLKRSVSRLHHKGCQLDPMYEKLARAYAEASPSADAYNFLAGVLEKNGDATGASQMRTKAFNLETDPNKKAKLKLMEAYDAVSSSKQRARTLANEALKYNPNLGKAYLLIASLYQKSANSCGKDEFEKRMVYVAALNKARKAQAVDPGCGAGRYISSYRKNIPSKKLILQKGVTPGSSHRVGCWIGETVRVPNL